MPIIHIGEKHDLLNEQCWENWISSWNINLDPIFIYCLKKSISSDTKALNARPEAWKLSKGKVRKTL